MDYDELWEKIKGHLGQVEDKQVLVQLAINIINTALDEADANCMTVTMENRFMEISITDKKDYMHEEQGTMH